MGARFITLAEYNYVKELLAKNNGDVTEVMKIHPRSRASINRIDQTDNFEHYQAGTYDTEVTKTPAKKTEEIAKRPEKTYDGAILAEMGRLRKAIEELTKTIQEKPKGLFG